MTYEEFRFAVYREIDFAEQDKEDKNNVLDLRVGRYPYTPNEDTTEFRIDEIEDAWDYVKDREEWYVDVYENLLDKGWAEFTGFAVASWEE